GAIVSELPARRSDRGRNLFAAGRALELVDCCGDAHGRSLGFTPMGIANDLASLDATAQADLVRKREVTSLELGEAAIDAAEQITPQINAIIHPRYAAAVVEAAGPTSGAALPGVPMVVKDLGCDMKGEPHHKGTRALKSIDYRSTVDSSLYRRFREAG